MADEIKKESAEDKFRRLAETRVNAVLQKIRILSNLSKPPYKFGDEQVEKIFQAIRSELSEVEEKFKKRGSKKTSGFSL
ncbi:MAG: hypothetical protein NT009_14045 [Proteobacteria bacterium]|jgi:chorismate mutase|nr:hypothetical protein [Pseudomonadota bacterium]